VVGRRVDEHFYAIYASQGIRPEVLRLYKARARIEQTVGKLKRFKRVALRCGKTKVNFEAIVCFAFVMILVKFVHMFYARCHVMTWRSDGRSAVLSRAAFRFQVDQRRAIQAIQAAHAQNRS
jgi:hypothetical protein